jgi:hypothetical protein
MIRLGEDQREGVERHRDEGLEDPAELRPDAMHAKDLPLHAEAAVDSSDLLAPLLQATAAPDLRASEVPPALSTPIHGVVIGELLAIADGGTVPLVRYPGQLGSAAARARTAADLHGAHVGAPLVLMFEQGDPLRPVVLGVLRERAGWPLPDAPAQVEVDADGQRMVVNAREQLVLRCGKASITLTKAGKVMIEGGYVLSRSTGVNRIEGGSVQLN